MAAGKSLRLLLLGALVALVATCTGLEIWLRSADYGALPLYSADPVVGYRAKPNSSGTFAGNIHWAFNDRGMRMDRPCHPGRNSILLLGDSIVHGGTMLDQRDTVGMQLAKQAEREVCPLGASSWALENELKAIEQSPEYLSFGTIVLISNSEDFVKPSVWASEVTHPTRPPASVLLLAAKKKISAWRDALFPHQKPASSALWTVPLGRFLSAYKGRLIVVVYPRQDEIDSPAADFALFERVLDHRATVIEPKAAQGWNPGLYRDAIHPNPAGAKQIGSIIARSLTANSLPTPAH